MTLGVTNDENYNDIADALREVGVGMSDATFTPSQMAPAIRGLRSIWGNIEGQLANQSDLQNALNAKANSADLGDMAAEDDAPSDDKQYGRKNGDWVPITDELANWGQIAGTLSDQTDLQDALDAKAPLVHDHDDRYYTETETDVLLDEKADASSVYTKTETDTLLDEKADSSSVYTKTETDTLLDAKADAADVYDKTETDIVVRDANTAVTGHLSDSIVSFDDGADSAFVKDLTVAVEPVQDLHGYDNPWPAGGGINLLDPSKMLPGYIENNGNIHTQNAQKEYYSPDYYEIGSAIKITVGYFGFVSGENKWIAISFYDANKNVINRLAATADKSVFTVSEGAVYFRVSMRTFDHGVDYCFSALGNVDSYSPYSNICPISGHSTVAVTRTGKNLLNTSGISYNFHGVTATVLEDGGIKFSGQTVDSYTRISIPIFTVKSGIYTLNVSGLKANTMRWISTGNPSNTGLPYVSSYQDFTKVFTVTKDTPFQYLYIDVYEGDSVDTIVYIQLELGSTATDYEPYSGTSVTIDLDGTRYGGMIDVTTGQMTVTHGITDLGNYNYTYQSNNSRFISKTQVIGMKYTVNDSTPFNGVCSAFPIISANKTTGGSGDSLGVAIAYTDSVLRIRYRDSGITDPSAFKAAMSGVQLVYELASPFTVQLTLSQMQTLLGENHIWADTGDVEVIYCKDTETYVASEINAYHDDTKATVITETASGSIASFSDGSALPVEDLKVSIDPVQDLHGYDNPWPAGGGKNLLDFAHPTTSSKITSITDNGNGAFTIVVSGGSAYMNYTIPVIAGETYCVKCESVSNTSGALSRLSVIYVYDGDMTGSVLIDGQTATTTRTFTPSQSTVVLSWRSSLSTETSGTGIITKPQLELGSTATAFAPYSNICPISGWSSAMVTRTGKNLVKIIRCFPSYPSSQDGITATVNSDGSIRLAGTKSSSPETFIWCVLACGGGTYSNSIHTPCFILPKGNYSISGIQLWSRPYINTSKNMTRISPACFYNETKTFTLTNDTPISNVNICKIAVNDSIDTVIYPQLVYWGEKTPSTEYIPYNGQTVTIDLNGTRYGGTLNVLTGEMTVDRVLNVYNGSETWTMTSAGKFFRNDLTGAEVASLTSYIPISNMYPYGGANSNPTVDKKFYTQITTYVRVWVVDSAYQTLEAWYAYLAQNNLQVCYYLASPFTVQLSPSQMQTLLGENHIFADTGDVEVTYRADSKMYIDQKVNEAVRKTKQIIAAVTDTMVAPSNLTAGDFIIVGDDLLKATSNIASGATLTIGSNCVKTTVAEALIALASA